MYDGQFSFEVERSLEVVEKFKDLGVDFTPAVKELRAALDEPVAYDNPNLSCKKVLDKWLKSIECSRRGRTFSSKFNNCGTP